MGQKLVSVTFTSGSSPQLWELGYNPRFKLEVSGSQGWTLQGTYYSNLTGKTLPSPLELGHEKIITDSLLKSFIRNEKRISFLVEDDVNRWRIGVQEDVLAPEGLYFPDELGELFNQ